MEGNKEIQVVNDMEHIIYGYEDIFTKLGFEIVKKEFSSDYVYINYILKSNNKL